MQMVCGETQAGAAATGSKRTRPAQQVAAQAGKQEAVSGDPAGRFQHGESTMHKVWRGCGFGQRGQRGAQGFGLRAKAAKPELAALVGRRGRQRGLESFRVEQSRKEKQRDHRDAGAQAGQRELRQQRDGALAGLA